MDHRTAIHLCSKDRKKERKKEETDMCLKIFLEVQN
jgi:hypothetical protein